MNKSITQNCLLITSTRLGDGVLSTAVLDGLHRAHPYAKFDIVCGHLPAPIFARCPYVDNVHILRKTKTKSHWFNLCKIVCSKKWLLIADLRNSFFSRLVRTRHRYMLDHRINQDQHKIKQFEQLLGMSGLRPTLWPDRHEGQLYIPNGPPVLALGPSSNWHAKTWPAERFIELVHTLRDLPGYRDWRLAIFAADSEADQVAPILAAFPNAINMVGRGDTAQMASALAQCNFFIGNDSGLMHMAAAVGIKTLGLFGPTDERIYGPHGSSARAVRTPQSVRTLLNIPDYNSKTCPNLMDGLSVAAVIEALSFSP